MPATDHPASSRTRVVVRAARLLLAVPTLVLFSVPIPARAFTSAAIAPGSIQLVSAPGIALHTPADGRINGDGFAATVTGYRFAARVGYGSASTTAAHGQRLLVFGLQGAPLIPGVDSEGNPTLTVTAVLSVDGSQQTLPTPGAQSSGPIYFLVSVPATARDIQLQLSNQGLTQAFSFTTDSRVGSQPDVLYRSKDSWEATDPVGQTITMATPDPNENLAGALTDVTLTAAHLTWFGPAGASDNPSAADQAWLVLDMSSRGHPLSPVPVGFALDYLSTLPGSAVTLTIPGQAQPIPATLAGRGGPVDESQNQTGWFGGIYYWQIPASLTSATVTVTPGTITAEKNYLGDPQTINVPGNAKFPLSFGSPYSPPPAPVSVPPFASGASLATAGTPARGGASGFPWLDVIVIPLIGLLGGGVFLARRRLRTRAEPPPAAMDPKPRAVATDGRGEPTARSNPQTAAGAAVAAPAPPLPPDGHTTKNVLLEPPAGPPPPPPASIRVDVLGVPRVAGWPDEAPPPGQTVLELLTFLVLHKGERFTTEQLRSRLGIGRDRDLDPATIRRYINELRRTLGYERIPETKAGGGYEVLNITSDAAELRDEVNLMRTASTPVERARRLARALSFVRGAPFADAPKGSFGWAETDPNQAAALTNIVIRAADLLASLALEHHDPELAAWAAEKGLLLSPTDESLLARLLSSAALNDPSKVLQAWQQIQTRLARYEAEPSPSLVAHYQQLLQAARRQPTPDPT